MANWGDRTLLRNDVAFEISRCTGLDWTPNGRFVEVVLNKKHVGNYYLCEQIRVEKNRIDITEMDASDVSEDKITGGYLLELDVAYDEKNKFKSNYCGFPYMIKEPNEEILQAAQMNYIQNYIKELEESLFDSVKLLRQEYSKYINVNSFIDYWFVQELTGNTELNHPKSFYMNKNRDDVIKAGPVWDFDFNTFNRTTYTGFSNLKAIYYSALFKDPVYVEQVKLRWTLLYPKFLKISEYIKQTSRQLRKSDKFNHGLWPISVYWSNINGGANCSYDEAVELIIKSYEAKLKWMDEQINNGDCW